VRGEGVIRFYWNQFLDWLTKRRISDFVVSAVGHLDGPVRAVHRLRDHYIVLTDREVYVVYEDYGSVISRRMR
jgi:hypothetical protein